MIVWTGVSLESDSGPGTSRFTSGRAQQLHFPIRFYLGEVSHRLRCTIMLHGIWRLFISRISLQRLGVAHSSLAVALVASFTSCERLLILRELATVVHRVLHVFLHVLLAVLHPNFILVFVINYSGFTRSRRFVQDFVARNRSRQGHRKAGQE